MVLRKKLTSITTVVAQLPAAALQNPNKSAQKPTLAFCKVTIVYKKFLSTNLIDRRFSLSIYGRILRETYEKLEIRLSLSIFYPGRCRRLPCKNVQMFA